MRERERERGSERETNRQTDWVSDGFSWVLARLSASIMCVYICIWYVCLGMGVRRVCNIKPVNTLKNKQRDGPTDRQTDRRNYERNFNAYCRWQCAKFQWIVKRNVENSEKVVQPAWGSQTVRERANELVNCRHVTRFPCDKYIIINYPFSVSCFYRQFLVLINSHEFRFRIAFPTKGNTIDWAHTKRQRCCSCINRN